MALIIWTTSDARALEQVVGPVIRSADVAHRVEPNIHVIPKIGAGDVVLAMGSRPLATLQKAGLLPKNRTITSLREKPITVAGATVLCTFDPTIVGMDYARLPEIQWDVQLATRILKTGSPRPEIGDYRYVESYHEIIEYVEDQYKKTGRAVPVACDLETKSLNPYNPEAWIISISFTARSNTADVMYFEKHEAPVRPEDGNPDADLTYWEGVWRQIHWLLTTDKITLRGANFKYDCHWLFEKWGIYVENLKFDTMLVGSLLDENRSNSLKLHAKIMTDMGGYEDDMDKYDFGALEKVPKDELLNYAGGDTDVTQQVADKMRRDLLQDRQLANFYVKLEQPSSRAFEAMERTGVVVDVPYMRQLESELKEEISVLHHQMLEFLPNKMKMKYRDDIASSLASGKSPFKPKILREFLFTKAGLNLKPKVVTEKTGAPSTAMDHLMMFGDDPVAAQFISSFKDLGSASKTLSTFVVGFMKHLREDGRFHPTYLLHRGDYGSRDSGTTTGRTSAKDPAVQCLKGDTLVLTDRGHLPIQQIVEGYEAGESFRVLTHTGKWRRVVGVYRNGVKKVFSVSSERGRVVVSTENHPYLTQRGWVRTDQLQSGDTCYELRAQDAEVHLANLPQLDRHEESVQQPDQQGLPEVRGPRHQGLREVAGLQELPRGHGREAEEGDVYRATGRGRELRAGELCMGDLQTASQQPDQHQTDYPQGQDHDRSSVGEGGRYFTREASLQAVQGASDGVSLDEGEAVELGVFSKGTITSIEPAGEYETFDLTIDGSHSFVANGVVVHNTIPKHSQWAKRLRRAYTAPEGKTIIQADFSQGELRIAAVVAEEPTMIKAYQTGADLHSLTAARLNGYSMEEFYKLPKETISQLRSGGKAGNFGLLYGMSANGFREYAFATYGVVMSANEAQIAREQFFDLYQGLTRWHETTKDLAHRWGHVRSPLGRVRRLPLINSRDGAVRAQSERQAINSPIQATLSDMMKLSMHNILTQYGDQVDMFMMTHDSVALYVPEGEEVEWGKRIKAIMENLPLKEDFGWDSPLKFYADVEAGATLADLEDLNL